MRKWFLFGQIVVWRPLKCVYTTLMLQPTLGKLLLFCLLVAQAERSFDWRRIIVN